MKKKNLIYSFPLFRQCLVRMEMKKKYPIHNSDQKLKKKNRKKQTFIKGHKPKPK